MTLDQTLAEVARLSVCLSAREDRLRYFPKTLPAELLSGLAAHKAELLDLLYEYDERAAIYEYDGGLCRDDAEALARLEIFGWARKSTPQNRV
ncbi:MAG: hypothetical protein K1X71_20045 [Pirellulales bacterium]|nr:hypothetical protein [Pirellulales bacterium]